MSMFEPWAGKRIGEFRTPKLPNLNPQQFDENQETTQEDKPSTSGKVKKVKPPVRKAITLSEEPQMDYNSQTTEQPAGRVPAKSTKRFPKLDRKQTAPGTKPKKK